MADCSIDEMRKLWDALPETDWKGLRQAAEARQGTPGANEDMLQTILWATQDAENEPFADSPEQLCEMVKRFVAAKAT